MNFCTLFDSSYLDRFLVMYDSLMRTCRGARIFVIAFDISCRDVLLDMALPGVVVISYHEFEDDILKEAKNNRSSREFFWTCGAYTIRYVIDRFQLPHVTYLDADLCFYDSPEQAVKAFLDSGCDVAIISHRFSKHPENNHYEQMFGKYCVEFNTFKNTPNARKVLDWWIDRCLEKCPEVPSDEAFGDQKYLDRFNSLFSGIYTYEDFGLGVAPWNIDDYVKDGPLIRKRHSDESGKLIFFHFHSLDLFPGGSSNIRVFVRPGKHDGTLVYELYEPYISQIFEKRVMLYEKYGLFDPDKLPKQVIAKDGEIKQFLTCEPNLWFLIRKIWRYLRYKKMDYINVGKSI